MIIGITGTNGAGKGAVVDYLVQKGFRHYSARELFTKEIEKRGLPVNRSTMREIGNEWRATYGPTHNIEVLYASAVEQGGDAVIESIRTVKEAEFLKEKGALLLAVDADRALRYERAVKRGSETDKVDFDTWVAEEEREWHNTAAHDMNIPAVIEMADGAIQNNGTLADLHTRVEEVLAQLA